MVEAKETKEIEKKQETKKEEKPAPKPRTVQQGQRSCKGNV